MAREFKTIDQQVITESPTVETAKGTGRARCRICGEKITKGSDTIVFYATLDEAVYNTWTATKCHAHTQCAPNVEVNDRIGMARYVA